MTTSTDFQFTKDDRSIKGILFDLGNTLLYFDNEWDQVVSELDTELVHQLNLAGIETNEQEFITLFRSRMQSYYDERESEFIEYTTAYILRTSLAELGHPSISDDVIKQVLTAMYAISQAHWKREKDTIPTLDKLRAQGYKLGMISNAGDDADVQTLVDNAQLRPYFDFILTSAAQGIRKPNPQIFYTGLKHWGYHPNQVVMVGDTLGADILGAHNAGLVGIWITRRADTPQNQAHAATITPDYTIDKLSDLPGLLELIPISK